MKKLSLILALLLTGCAVEYESEETTETYSEEDEDNSMPGYGQGGTYPQGCGTHVEELEFNGETIQIELPIMCDPYWWMHTPPGDPPPMDLKSNPDPYSNPPKEFSNEPKDLK